jgi:hypothetical protein
MKTRIHSLMMAFIALAFLACWSGCVAYPAANMPGGTLADFSLKRDTYKIIGAMENGRGGSFHPTILDTKVTEPAATANGAWTELWTVSRGGNRIDYRVIYTPSPQGGTQLRVTLLTKIVP